MRNNESGYATVTVTGLLAALSVIGVGFFQLSETTVQLSDRVASKLILDGELEAIAADTLADLANGDTLVADYPKVETIGDQNTRITVSVELDREKLQLKTLEAGELESFLETIEAAPADIRFALNTLQQRGDEASGHFSMNDLFAPGTPSAIVSCARSQITEYSIPAVFKRESEKHRLDGETLRLQVKADRSSVVSRNLDIAVLFTGDDRDPMWVLNWDRYDLNTTMECPA